MTLGDLELLPWLGKCLQHIYTSFTDICDKYKDHLINSPTLKDQLILNYPKNPLKVMTLTFGRDNELASFEMKLQSLLY